MKCCEVFTIIDRKLILLTSVLNCLGLYNKQNITRRFEDMNFIFSRYQKHFLFVVSKTLFVIQTLAANKPCFWTLGQGGYVSGGIDNSLCTGCIKKVENSEMSIKP